MGEHSRPGVHRNAAKIDLTHLPAGLGGALDHGDLKSRPGELDRAGQAADSRPDNDDLSLSHLQIPAASLISTIACV